MAVSGGMDFDFSGVNQLAADLARMAVEAIPNLVKAVEVNARHIKDDWQDEAAKSNPSGTHARRYPRSVDYDMILGTDGQIGAEIGPNLAKSQGALGILEESTGGVKGTPQHNRDRAVRKNMADFERGVLKATEGYL